MATVLDYLLWRGDLTLHERPMNEVDALVFSILAYVRFESFGGECLGKTLSELAEIEIGLAEKPHYGFLEPTPLLHACAHSARFRDVRLERFASETDPEKQIQFAASAFSLPNGTNVVSFRGTDDTIVGWREDFDFSFMEQTPAQREAIRFLNDALSIDENPFLVTGHSKGGNLALCASAFCRAPDRILLIYSHDGPGVNDFISQRPEYQAIQPKVSYILPEGSLIGIIFSDDLTQDIVQSGASGTIRQHDPTTWFIERDRFLRADARTSMSRFADDTLEKWLASVDLDHRRAFFNAVFDALEAEGVTRVSQINVSSLTAIFKAARKDGDGAVFFGAKKLAAAGRDVLIDSAKERIDPLLSLADTQKLAEHGANLIESVQKRLEPIRKHESEEESSDDRESLKQRIDHILHREDESEADPDRSNEEPAKQNILTTARKSLDLILHREDESDAEHEAPVEGAAGEQLSDPAGRSHVPASQSEDDLSEPEESAAEEKHPSDPPKETLIDTAKKSLQHILHRENAPAEDRSEAEPADEPEMPKDERS